VYKRHKIQRATYKLLCKHRGLTKEIKPRARTQINGIGKPVLFLNVYRMKI